MVKPDDLLVIVLGVGVAVAADRAAELLLPDVRWAWIALVCVALGAVGGLAAYLQSIKIGSATVRPRWSCLVPLAAHVVPAAAAGLLVASAAYGAGGGMTLSPWTFFAAGICGWRTRWAIDLVAGAVERWARGAKR